jgi:peptide chain release factor 3
VDAKYESVAVTTARWLESDDPKAIKEIMDKVPQSLAYDGADNLTFLATSVVNLNLNQERYPKVRFLSTREH